MMIAVKTSQRRLAFTTWVEKHEPSRQAGNPSLDILHRLRSNRLSARRPKPPT
jgi:hypothetical protein